MGLSNQTSLDPPIAPLSPSVPDERDDVAGAAKERGGGAGTPEETGGGAGTSTVSKASTNAIMAVAMYDYTAREPEQLTLKVGDHVQLHTLKVKM